MIEAGILDGDTVVIKKQDTAESGDIVVALIDDEEATLKRLRKRGASIALEAAIPAYETRIFGPDRVNIQGKLAQPGAQLGQAGWIFSATMCREPVSSDSGPVVGASSPCGRRWPKAG